VSSHDLANKLTVVYGYLFQIRKNAIAQGADIRFIDIRDMAEMAIGKLDAVNKELAESIMEADNDKVS